MKILFRYNSQVYKTSPDFSVTPQQEDDFFNSLGDENEDSELFWNSDISGNNGNVIVDWFEKPTSPDDIIKNLTKLLKVKVPNYKLWT